MATAKDYFKNPLRNYMFINIEVLLLEQDIPNNRSRISWKIWIDSTKSTYYYNWPNAGNKLFFYIDEAYIGGMTDFTMDFRSGSPSYGTYGDAWINHGADGKKTAAIKGRYIDSTSHPSLGPAEVLLSFVLTDIPRGMVTVGTPSGNKRGQTYVGTPSGNKLAKEVWVGTASGNKRAI